MNLNQEDRWVALVFFYRSFVIIQFYARCLQCLFIAIDESHDFLTSDCPLQRTGRLVSRLFDKVERSTAKIYLNDTKSNKCKCCEGAIPHILHCHEMCFSRLHVAGVWATPYVKVQTVHPKRRHAFSGGIKGVHWLLAQGMIWVEYVSKYCRNEQSSLENSMF